jgi:sugar lactone lactonase YvrE
VLKLGEGEERDLVPPAEAPFVRPNGIAVAPSGRVFVSDSWRSEVFVFEADGTYLQRFGKRGLGPVEFFEPAGLALKSPERLIVLDHGNHRAQILTLEGELVHAFGARLFTQPIRNELARRARVEAGLPAEPGPDDEE